MEQDKMTFGTGEVDIESKQDEIRERTRSLFGTGKVDLWS
jgi:hypothetical protein